MNESKRSACARNPAVPYPRNLALSLRACSVEVKVIGDVDDEVGSNEMPYLLKT